MTLRIRVKCLEDNRVYKSDYNILRRRFTDLSREFNSLLEHLKLEVVEEPSRRVVKSTVQDRQNHD